MKKPKIVAADFSDASVDITGPAGGFSAILYIEKEGFGPQFKAVNLANRYDLMIISNKGVSVTAARKLIDDICGHHDIPLFVLHDFDVAGFMILSTLQRNTRRYQFVSAFEVIDLGLQLGDIEGLEREPAAATKTKPHVLRNQLAANGATEAEIGILLGERVELNAMTSDAMVTMVERKLKGLTEPGYNLDDDDPRVTVERAALTKQEAELARLKRSEEEHGARRRSLASLVNAAETWIKAAPTGMTIAMHPPIEPQLKKGESIADAVERLRRRGRELQADLDRVAASPWPSSLAREHMRRQITGLAVGQRCITSSILTRRSCSRRAPFRFEFSTARRKRSVLAKFQMCCRCSHGCIRTC